VRLLLDAHAFLWFVAGDERLPLHHHDPFDRLLAAQALVERLPLVTADSLFRQYGVKTIW
jgi:PIN domain nuclease of toxin-antitoxin system